MASLIDVQPEVVRALESKLKDANTTLAEKYRVMFSLRNIRGETAHAALATALCDGSALLRHDVAFCMGQRQDPLAIQVLTDILKDDQEHPMVRHEAGEALGAIGTEECLRPLRQHQDDSTQEVAETCQLALQRIEYFAAHPSVSDESSPYYSVDPTPALPLSTPVEELRSIFLDESTPIFLRYRALFALRNRGGDEAVAVLGEAFGSSSALLKHEVAYVLGQLQHPSAVEVLTQVLQDPKEAAMVRHEAAEALGAIAQPRCVQLLKEFCHDAEPIVADSCMVALDVLEFESSGGFEYADVRGAGEATAQQAAAITAQG